MFKLKNRIVILFISFVLLLSNSCTTSNLKSLISSPEFNISGINLKSIDMDGFTFDLKYSVKNPYPVSLSMAGLNADVVYNGETPVTSISADNGFKVSAMSSSSNSVLLNIPYSLILELAKQVSSGKKLESIPLTVNGNALLDTSNVPLISSSTLKVPFKKSFNVPVFKPSLSVSSPSFSMPSKTELKDAFVSGGMSLTKAASMATAILSGGKLASDAFDGIDIDLKFSFNLNVKNEGSCDWNYILDSCQLTLDGNRIASVSPSNGNAISSSSGSIPVTCKLNTVQAGKYIVQLLNRTASNPVVKFDSSLSFPGITEYFGGIPLDYEKEIPISSVKR
ncbi:MAG: LEA type 2 family protein [Treponema sp.]|nr:LEA type 2 family protein [Treponema sp.]